MNRVLASLLLAALLSGCGPSLQEQRAARMRALQMDLDAAHDRWKADMAGRRFAKNADAMRELERRYRDVYAQWGLQADPLSQAILSYAVALASRVDRGQLPGEEANRLYEKMRTDIEAERGKLAVHATQAQRDTLMLR